MHGNVLKCFMLYSCREQSQNYKSFLTQVFMSRTSFHWEYIHSPTRAPRNPQYFLVLQFPPRIRDMVPEQPFPGHELYHVNVDEKSCLSSDTERHKASVDEH
uniref:Uncharacterized protein n=1 Tax=Pyxicephalus adspersus TaxID=30357 RepID=A0AAV2ZXK8_PYXAD|nr:TPA: hypothetical protein GDO54_003625 [Pyxicephalus adspersus]